MAKNRDEMHSNLPTGPLANTIGKDTEIEGQIKTTGNLRIDGKVKGVVNSKSKVVVGPSGFIDGDLYCQSADIAGTVNGKIHVEEIVHLKSTATANGDVMTKKIVVEDGAKILGMLDVGGLNKSTTSSTSGETSVLTKEAV